MLGPAAQTRKAWPQPGPPASPLLGPGTQGTVKSGCSIPACWGCGPDCEGFQGLSWVGYSLGQGEGMCCRQLGPLGAQQGALQQPHKALW